MEPPRIPRLRKFGGQEELKWLQRDSIQAISISKTCSTTPPEFSKVGCGTTPCPVGNQGNGTDGRYVADLTLVQTGLTADVAAGDFTGDQLTHINCGRRQFRLP